MRFNYFCKMKNAEVIVLLGGNEGNVLNTFITAKKLIIKNIGFIEKESSIYRSPSWGFESSKPFLNQVISVQTNLSSSEVLHYLMQIETKLGRIRDSKSIGYTNRTIDLDILYRADQVLKLAQLQIPHPAIPERRFTLLPLVEILPDFKHPILNISQMEMLKQCGDNSEVIRI